MAITGISLAEEFEYISQFDTAKTEDEGATVFILGSLTVEQRAKIVDSNMFMEQDAAGTSMFKMSSGTRNLTALRYGLKGWRNFIDAEGNPIKFVSETKIVNGSVVDQVLDESIARLSASIQAELAEKIINSNTLSEEEEKNLQGLSLQRLNILNSTVEDAAQKNVKQEAITKTRKASSGKTKAGK